MPLTNQKKCQHLLWRAGFGPALNNIALLNSMAPGELYSALKTQSSSMPAALYSPQAREFQAMHPVEKKQKVIGPKKQSSAVTLVARDDLYSINISWINNMVNSKAQLREKMAFFWNGHFACNLTNPYYQEALVDTIRANALGNFGDLLRLVSKSAAMITFLNNQNNKKGQPNENFAREVMELFTMGRGSYKEADIKEGARAFTGWQRDENANFIFNERAHDAGSKTFLGKTGNFNGDDILDIILGQKQTALFITKKIYSYFVNENVTNDVRIQMLANRFYNNKYDIGLLLDDIYTSDWFYDEANIGSNIKAPIELLVGIMRMVPTTVNDKRKIINLQTNMGQLLLRPRNVGGWPKGRNWIDTSTVMLRLKLPQVLTGDRAVDVPEQRDDDIQMGTDKKPGALVNIGSENTWQDFNNVFNNVKPEQLFEHMANLLLQVAPSALKKNILTNAPPANTGADLARKLAIGIMSTPEYQVC